MDTSETYIEMCEKAEEIQAFWKPTGGDWLVFDYRGTTKTSRDFEKEVWGDDNKTWNRVEILCYQPSDLKDWWVGTQGEESLVKSSCDLTKERCVWLPRQDQLQEMINLLGREFAFKNEWTNNKAYSSNMTSKTMVWRGQTGSWVVKADSMEQLWLAFIMHEKYGKVWNGENWVKERRS